MEKVRSTGTGTTTKSKDKLTTLETALNKEHMKALFSKVFESRLNGSRLVGVDVFILRQRSKRCVMRYELHLSDSESGRQSKLGIIGKVFSTDFGQQVSDFMSQLWGNGFHRTADDCISIPEPLGYDPSLRLLLQEEIPGVPIKNLLKNGADASHMKLLANALAKLHRSTVAPVRIMTVREHLMRCHPKHEFLSVACPDLAPSIEQLVRTAYEIEQRFGDIERTLLHGDFHPGQVHLHNGSIWLIDFDALSWGDPAADLGNLLVFLKGKVRKNPDIPYLIDAFFEEYFSIMDDDIAGRIPLFEALTHLRRACKCLRLQKPGWTDKAKRMIREATETIDRINTAP